MRKSKRMNKNKFLKRLIKCEKTKNNKYKLGDVFPKYCGFVDPELENILKENKQMHRNFPNYLCDLFQNIQSIILQHLPQ